MPASDLFISGEVTDDDSSLSVNSTVPSEQKDEYPLEGILGERVSNGIKEYLVKWEGYPYERCTWETESNFQNETTIPEWEHQKMRIIRGLDKPFDVSALETKVEKWVAETNQRKARRKAKRIRMGLIALSQDTEDEEPADIEYHGDTSSSEATEEGFVSPVSPPDLRTEAHRRKKSSSSTVIKSEQDKIAVSLDRQRIERSSILIQRQRLREKSTSLDEGSETVGEVTKGRSSTEEPLIQDRQKRKLEVTHEQNQRANKRPAYLAKDLEQAHDNGTSNTLSERKKGQINSRPNLNLKKPLGRPIPDLQEPSRVSGQNLGQAGRGPARLGRPHKSSVSGPKPRVSGAAILGNWATKTRVRKPLALQQKDIREEIEPSQAFGKLSIKRRYEKAGRQEPAPDPDKLIFINVKDGKPVKQPSAILTPVARQAPFQTIRERLVQAENAVEAHSGHTDVAGLANDDNNVNMILDARRDSPQDVEASETLMQSGYSHSNQETSILTSEALRASRRGSAPESQRFIEGPIQSPKVDLSRRISVPSAMDQSSFPSLGYRGSLERREKEPSQVPASRPMQTERTSQAVLPPAHQRLPHKLVGGASAWSERREPSRRDSVNQISVSPSKRTDIHSDSMDIMQRLPLSMLQADSGYHTGLHSENLQSQKHEHKGLENFSDILGTIIIGLEHKDVADVRFRGLTKTCKRLFMRIKIPPRQMHIWCKHICNAEEYTKYFHTEKDMYYGAGHIVPWANNQNMMNVMTDTLIQHNAGGLFFSSSYSLIIYPSGVNSWKFFDDRFVDSPQAALRFVMFTPILELLNHTTSQMARIPNSLTTELESDANLLFRQFFGIKFTNLLWNGNTNNARRDNFYLMYPVELGDEKTVISRWLEVNNAKIYSSFEVGDWDRFTSSVEAGVVLIHESVTRLHLIPHLARLLRRPFNMFFINLQRNHLTQEKTSAISGLKRLFPHGAGILLTDSLFLNCPEAAVRILTWFRIFVLHSKPNGTWKLVTRPRIRDWILSIVEERTKEEGHVFMQIYEQIYYILPLELMDETDDYETPKDEAPIVSSRGIATHSARVGLGDKRDDVSGIFENDNSLVEWYAGWTRTKVEFHRKFHIVHGGKEEAVEVRKGWTKKWSYIAALTPDEFFKVHGITEWEIKDKDKAEERHRKREKRKSSFGGLERMAV